MAETAAVRLSPRGIFLLPAAFGAVLTACATMTVETEHEPGTDFSTLKTYAWIPRPPRDTIASRFDEAFVEKRVREAVDAGLAAKGYRKTGADADFFVAYHAALATKMSNRTIHERYGYSQGLGVGAGSTQARAQLYEYDEGSLLLDVVEARTRRLMWRGSVRTKVDSQASRERNAARIDEAVRLLLARFPPK